MNKLILLTTTETSTLLAQVAERIDDIRRLSVARRDALIKLKEKENSTKPVQVVSPEKAQRSFEPPVDKKDIEVVRAEFCREPPSSLSISREAHVLAELVNTERTYVAELESIVECYVDRFEAPENQSQIATPIRGRPDLVFGNIRDLLLFHSKCFLPELLASDNSPSTICRSFLQHQPRFLALYYAYCQNKSTSEAIRKEFADSTPFFSECQRLAAHPLPLGAYLLKPVQRITKYQLLLKELERHCRIDVKPEIEAAVHCMLDLLAQINSAIQQLHIIGFAGDLRLMGPLRLQTECDVFAFHKKKGRRTTRAQRRQLFLFDGGLILCKKRPAQAGDTDFYEFKNCIPTSTLFFAEQSKSGLSRFDVWDETKGEGWAVETIDVSARIRWTECLGRLSAAREDHKNRDEARPKSWSSTLSSDSAASSSRAADSPSDSVVDSNGNASSSSLTLPLTPSLPTTCVVVTPPADDIADEAPPLPKSLPPSITSRSSLHVPTIEESHAPDETVNC